MIENLGTPRARTLGLVACGLLAVGCGSDETPAETPGTSAKGSVRAPGQTPGATSEADTGAGGGAVRVSDTGVDDVPVTLQRGVNPAGGTATLHGRVAFEGRAPEPQQISMDHIGGCRQHGPILTERVLVSEDGGLQNVVVYVSQGVDRATFPPVPEEPALLDQFECVYRPHVLVVRAGQTLQIRNSDATQHNVDARPQHGSNRPFNKTMARKAEDLEVVFPRPEMGISFGCNIHSWMKAYVTVVEHDFYAVSDEDGNWSIEGLSPGDYVVESWHEKYGKKKVAFSIGAGDSADVGFVYASRRERKE